MSFFKLLVAIITLALLSGCGGGSRETTAAISDTDCSVYPAQASSAYVLPFPVGSAYTVSGTTAHPAANRYAIDFLMPIGSSITAARAGKVYQVKEDSFDADHAESAGNYVFILHDDQTLGLYGHITHDGAMVSAGDLVTQGQSIALSGNSGLSNAPHLHFEVVRCSVTAWTNGVNCPDANVISTPTVFRNTSSTPCGLQPGQTYAAGAY